MNCNGCGKKFGITETRYLITCGHGTLCGCQAATYLCEACNHHGGFDGRAVHGQAALQAAASLGPEPAVFRFGTALMVGDRVISFKPVQEAAR